MKFYKYHGLGNDYFVYDCNQYSEVLTEAQIELLCNRNFGMGSDGILAGPIFRDNKIEVKIYNPDGSEAEKSGNGVRIFSRYLKEAGYVKEKQYTLSTLGGDVTVAYLDDEGTRMEVQMGNLSFLSTDIGVVGREREVVDEMFSFGGKEYCCTCVSIGNPHCVIPLEEVSKELVCKIGQYSESALYFPNRINTQIVKILNRSNIQIEIYERGAGYTLASGSSSCAAAGAVYKLGLVDKEVNVHMPGGILEIAIRDDNQVFMTGDVRSVGIFELSEEYYKSVFA